MGLHRAKFSRALQDTPKAKKSIVHPNGLSGCRSNAWIPPTTSDRVAYRSCIHPRLSQQHIHVTRGNVSPGLVSFSTDENRRWRCTWRVVVSASLGCLLNSGVPHMPVGCCERTNARKCHLILPLNPCELFFLSGPCSYCARYLGPAYGEPSLKIKTPVISKGDVSRRRCWAH